jgi:hypothetical protein
MPRSLALIDSPATLRYCPSTDVILTRSTPQNGQ